MTRARKTSVRRHKTPMSYRQMLSGLIEELQDNEAVVVEEPYLGQGLTAPEARTIAARHGVVLADPVLDFFTQINGGIIEWRLAPNAARRLSLRRPADANSISGRAYFYRLDEMLEDPALAGTPYEQKLTNPAALRDFRPFDKNVEEAFAGFMVTRGRLSDKTTYLRQYKDLAAFGATLRQYIEALVQCKAFLWWQDAFVARPGQRATADLYHYVPQLFPGETLDRFR
jgi:hypothetical protein